MKQEKFRLDQWKILTIIGMIYIVADIVIYIRNRMKNGEPIFARDLLSTLIGGE